MAVSPVITQNSAAVPTNSSAKETSSVPKSAANSNTGADGLLNNFMELLVAQMKNQDPTNPMDNNQLTAQLAQFNTAAGVQQLNTTLNSVGTLVSSMQQMNAAEWGGRKVLVEGTPSVSTSGEGNKELALSLNSDADEVIVTLTDSMGNAYTATLKNVKAGVHQYKLDDLNGFQPSDPREQADAAFKVSYSAKNADGSTPSIVALKKAKVEAVSFTPTGAVLQLGIDGTATLGEVYLIE
ncbi:MAG: flagellar biosynthesis protein FlgD [Enterobacteriaceae bacterium]|jgi:flagellar basal-body rod modification protein FlgD|nr:flagellar biosynthesis protein FlgD [Enterobacteriaceae bacterium]